MTIQRHTITVGDTLTPLGVTLKQRNSSGVLTAVDLTGLTVRFKMTDEDGNILVNESTTGVTVVDAEAGQVQYDFQAADVDTAGIYYGWFTVYDGPGTGDERDTYPVGGRLLEIVINESL